MSLTGRTERPTNRDHHPTPGSDLPRHYLVEWPQPVLELSELHRRHRTRPADDGVVLDDCRFFVRGELYIPVQDEAENQPLGYVCWVELGERGHLIVESTRSQPGREMLAPLPAELANSLPPFYDTMGLEALLVLQPLGERPRIILGSPGPLTELQQNGLTPAEFRALAIDLFCERQGALSGLGE